LFGKGRSKIKMQGDETSYLNMIKAMFY
jgi:hypothetical protein